MIRYVPSAGWRLLLRVVGQAQTSNCSQVAAGLHPNPCGEGADKSTSLLDSDSTGTLKTLPDGSAAKLSKGAYPVHPPKPVERKTTGIVAAAFESLKNEVPKKDVMQLEAKIASAETPEKLLSISQVPHLSRRHALKIISRLADWTTSGRIKVSDFEADTRFLKLCKLLGRGLPKASKSLEEEPTGFGDLALVLGVTGDDEAAKLVAGISLRQMIRVMSSLAQKKRRSTPLLHSLAFNIAKQNDKLDVKECADILYAMAVLNFPDEVLLEKMCLDLCECVSATEKPAVIGSILRSLGLMRYKSPELLNLLAGWVVQHIAICRPQDVFSLLQTLAIVDHIPDDANKVFEAVVPHLTMKDTSSAGLWLDVVWSLVVLGAATPQHVASILDPAFYENLIPNTDDVKQRNVASRLKLLNINAAAQLKIKGYKGPLLAHDSYVRDVPLVRSKEKQYLVSSVLDSFSNLFSSSTYLQLNVKTEMGFILDGECLLDSKCNPLPVSGKVAESSSEQSAEKISASTSKSAAAKKGIRIGIMVWDYKDMCRGCETPNGIASLSTQLLEASDYKVLAIPYTEFSPREKLVRRVQYLEHKLKSIVKSSQNSV